jgi:hypothetical protein
VQEPASQESTIEGFLEEWHRIVREKDIDAIASLLAEDVRIGAPPYWAKIEGRAVVAHLLGLILHTIDEFTYHRQWRDGSELALEFTGKVGELDLQGIDLISVDSQGRLANIDVPMRPINAVLALRETIAPQMQAFLESL